MAGGEHEAVAVEPAGVPGVEPEELVEEDVAQGSAAHRETRVPGVGLLHGVHGQEPDGVHRLLYQLGRRRLPGGVDRGARSAAGRAEGECSGGTGGTAPTDEE